MRDTILDDTISIRWLAIPAGMNIHDFEVIEFVRFAKGPGDEYWAESRKGPKKERATATIMRTDFGGKVIIYLSRAAV